MKLTAVPPIVHQAARANDDLSLVIQQQDWLKTISLGQIIKGKVLKVYDGNRYGILMGGHERVVDSTIAFKVGQQLSAKVTDIHGEKVSLKLVERDATDQSTMIKETPATPKTLVENLASQFNLQLSDLQKQAIDSIARQFMQEPLAIKVALYLAKMGLPISDLFIRDLIKNANSQTQLIKLEPANPRVTQSFEVDRMPALYQAIAATFSGEAQQEDLKDSTPRARATAQTAVHYKATSKFEQHESGFDADSEYTPFMKLLNIDTEGAIAHSFDVLSIIINDRLLEFDVAFFDQAHAHVGATLSKQIVFELDTLSGKVGVVAKLVNNRLSLAFQTEHPQLLNVLQQQKDGLAETLTQAGWILEQASYAAQAERASAMAAVIDHVLTQGSMERML